MDDIVTKERYAFWFKIGIFGIIFFSLFYGAYEFLKPQKRSKFDALESLTFEALSLAKDVNNDKLTFPSEHIKDIEGFFSNSMTLGFKPELLKEQPEYEPVGAMVLDYEVAKIAVTKWVHKTKEPKLPLLHFVFQESWDQLPKSVEAKEGQLAYQSYSSQDIYLIAWHDQKNPELVHFLAGFETHQDLAKIAARS